MLEIRTNCENCNRPLPPGSQEAMICSYECTFCSECVSVLLLNVCPNCGGGFEKRPVRPKEKLERHPAKSEPVFKPVDQVKFQLVLRKNRDIEPHQR